MASNPPYVTYPCTVCSKPTARWCTRCQAVWYCTSEHLVSDWPRHKKECSPVPGAIPGSPSMPPPLQMRPIDVSAILFLPDEDRPRIQVIGCQSALASPGPGSGADGAGCPDPLIGGYFTTGKPESVVLTQGLNNETLRYPLQLWYCPTSLAHRKPVNKAIERITAGKAQRAWCGPVVVLKYSGSRRQGYADATPNELTALSAYFIAYK